MTQAASTTVPIIGERYRIEERLGANRLAMVYRAFDERLQRKVLVHLLRKELIDQPQLRQRFVEEAHASARRSHQSLLELFDSGEMAGRPYMVTEFVAGRTIRELGALSPEEALLYFRQLVGAIAVSIAAGVSHPPISSRNLMVVDDGHVELVENWQTPTADVGRDLASYRAPERTESTNQTNAATATVYALGLLLLEMLTGRRAFDGADARSAALSHLSGRVPTISELRPALRVPPLEQIVAKATARRPEDRYPDVAALGQALDELWRALNAETQRLAGPAAQRPRLRERIGRAAAQVAPQAAPAPLIQPPVQPASHQNPPVQPDPDLMPPRQQSRRRSLTGLVVILVLFAIAAVIAYSLAQAVISQVAGIQMPSLGITLPSIPSSLPEWLTGVVSGGEEVYVVSGVADEGLNLRDSPSTTSGVITLLPNGTLMRKIGGPQTADSVSWLFVRTRVGDQEFQGWVSLNYVKAVSN